MVTNEFISSEYTLLIIGILVLGAICANLIMYLQLRQIKRKIKNPNFGHSSKDSQKTFRTLEEKLRVLETKNRISEEKLKTLDNKTARSIRGVETVRFNPFKGNGEGGNQSFATSFIDERGNGVVISSLYSRERVSVFAKPVVEFSSEFRLSEEEKKVLERSKNKLKDNS